MSELEWRKLKDEQGNPAAWLVTIHKRSGVYLIRSREGFAFMPGPLLYIGESHTGNLKRTLLRHFQKWKGPTSGNTFEADAVEIAVIRCPAERAVSLQNDLIAEYRPKLNVAGNPDKDAGPEAPDAPDEPWQSRI